MLAIRLARVGKKNQPSYRIVVIDHKRATNAKPKEIIGFYNPLTDPVTVNLKKDRAEYWIKNGARVNITVSRFVKNLGIDLKESQIINKNKPSKKKKKDKEEGGDDEKKEASPAGDKKDAAPKEEIKEDSPKEEKKAEKPPKEDKPDKPKEEPKKPPKEKPKKEEPKKDAKPEVKK